MGTVINNQGVETTGSVSASGGKILQTYLLDITSDGQLSFTLPFTYVDGDLIFVSLFNKELVKGADFSDPDTGFVVSGNILTINPIYASLSVSEEQVIVNG